MNAAAPRPPKTVTITAVNALAHAEAIKELFCAHARPEFPEFFERAYPRAFANGATSWLGRDPGGRLVMHIACFPHRFTFGTRQVVAGLIANLMVATPYRAFFPALKLVQRLIQDAKVRGDIDFLYADPNAESRSLLRGTRLQRIGTLERYVLPVADRRAWLNAGIRVFHVLLRVAARAPRGPSVVATPARQVRLERVAWPPTPSSHLVPQPDESLYASRLKGYPAEHDCWFTSSDAAILVRGPDPGGVAGVNVVRWPAQFAPWSFLPDLIVELRRRGCQRLSIMTLAESNLARVLRRSGFIRRSDRIPLFAHPLTPLGAECVRAVRGWEITDLDCDR